MIYTVTLNPSIDLFVELKNLKLGHENDIVAERSVPGGKAINVSRILSSLRIPTIATGFTGGFQGEFINDWLGREKIKTNFVSMDNHNRTNIKLFENGQETMINFPGPTIKSSEVDELVYYLSRVREGDTIIFGGSVPPMEDGLDNDIYTRLVSVATANGADFVADVPARYLLDIVKQKPLLVKPNGEDIEEIFNVRIENKEDFIPYGKKLVEMGAKYVIISYGAHGSMFFTENEVYQSTPVEDGREIINTVACRDAMIGGFIGTIVRDGDPIESYKMSVASASATARVLDLPSRDEIMKMLDLVVVDQVK
ncbi:1-phosphofructokinase family hexose kinase [uncultured Anaerococcus sp.]|uniref:1-phosphofructokinase family hexose kinase n=1 Tax=uncultured Anaerococcus sp. TaxID=293428 RepID=UPI002624E0E5|nr:1-phosphofructokinase family hexose kinase [uncultured Anaerococcus sp.]